MGAVRTKALADLRRRRVQSVVIAAVLFLASVAATLALGILVESRAPFDRAFSAANGAHLVVDYRSDVPVAAIEASARADGVTSAAGPWTVVPGAVADPRGGPRIGGELSSRPTPDATIDRVTIVAGRWWGAAGEIVLDLDTARTLARGIGDTVAIYPAPTAGPKPGSAGGELIAPGLPGGEAGRELTVVGIAGSVSTPDVSGWLSPADVAAVAGDGHRPDQQMLYRVSTAGTPGELATAIRSITTDLSPDAVVGTSTYLDVKQGVDRQADLYVPVLLVFSVFALLAAGFTIANAMSGIVLTAFREIGVMKAIGFTPGQVVSILVGEMLLPVVAGAGFGVVVGTLLSRPILDDTAMSFGLPPGSAVSLPIVAAVLGLTSATALIAAIGPALRAGRLSVVVAISHGVAPSTHPDGGRLRRLGLALPLGLPARLGVAAGVAHPVRAAMTLGALVVGVVAVTFAVGLDASLLRVKDDLNRTQASPVRAELPGADAATAAGVTAAFLEDPLTARAVAAGTIDVDIAGLGAAPFAGYDGDASWIGYQLIRGRWFSGPGEAVAPTAVFVQGGLALGDTISVSRQGRTVGVRLVGEIFDSSEKGSSHLSLRGAWSDLSILAPGSVVSQWEMQPRDGVEAGTYRSSLIDITGRTVDVWTVEESSGDAWFVLFLTVVGFLGVVLVVTSLAGVFNTVLLETRQRTHEIAVLKAIGLTPGQVIRMILATVIPVALVAGFIGVPLGLLAQRAVLTYMGETAAATAIPESVFDVLPAVALIGLALTGLVIGVAGAILPAQRIARAEIAPVLATE